MKKDDPLAGLSGFPFALAVVGCLGFLFLSFVGDRDAGRALELQNGRNTFGALLVILGGAAWIGVLGGRRRAWRGPLVMVAVGAMILPGAAWGAVAAIALVGWLEQMGPRAQDGPGDGRADGSDGR